MSFIARDFHTQLRSIQFIAGTPKHWDVRERNKGQCVLMAALWKGLELCGKFHSQARFLKDLVDNFEWRHVMKIMRYHFDGLVQDCSVSSALAIKILQSCTKPPIYTYRNLKEDM